MRPANNKPLSTVRKRLAEGYCPQCGNLQWKTTMCETCHYERWLEVNTPQGMSVASSNAVSVLKGTGTRLDYSHYQAHRGHPRRVWFAETWVLTLREACNPTMRPDQFGKVVSFLEQNPEARERALAAARLGARLSHEELRGLCR